MIRGSDMGGLQAVHKCSNEFHRIVVERLQLGRKSKSKAFVTFKVMSRPGRIFEDLAPARQELR